MKRYLACVLLVVAGMAPAQSNAPARPLPFSVDGLPIGAIPKQELPAGSCAAFLWTTSSSHALIAMLTADPARIRFAPGGAVTDLVRVRQQGEGDFGFLASTDYAGGDFRVRVEMEITKRGDLTDGGVVSAATVEIDRDGQDSVIVPAVGLIGCG